MLASSGYGFNLADAASICLDSCPPVRNTCSSEGRLFFRGPSVLSRAACSFEGSRELTGEARPRRAALIHSLTSRSPARSAAHAQRQPVVDLQVPEGRRRHSERQQLAGAPPRAAVTAHPPVSRVNTACACERGGRKRRYPFPPSSPQVPNLGAWASMGYNYFNLLNQSQIQTSCQLQARRAARLRASAGRALDWARVGAEQQLTRQTRCVCRRARATLSSRSRGTSSACASTRRAERTMLSVDLRLQRA